MNFDDINIKNYEIATPYPNITVTTNELKNLEPDNGVKTISMLINAYAGNKGEFTASAQYIYQSFLVKKEYEHLYELLEKVAIKEMQHMEILSQILVNLNVNPKFCRYIDNNINICNNWSANHIKYITDIKEFINYNITLETDAIHDYNQILQTTYNENLKEIINRILMDEKLHLELFYAISNRITENTPS